MVSIHQLLDQLNAADAKLVAVSKTHSPATIVKVYEEGQRDFGENKVQELVEKQEALPKDIRWHFIGHLQTNKVKYLAAFVHLIHAVDSWKLIREIEKRAGREDRTIDILLQVKIAEEDSKYGLSEEQLQQLLDENPWRELQHVRICGLMGMATYTDDEEQVRAEFRRLKQIFDQLKDGVFSGSDHFREISMGMSGDYSIALEEGSTMIRVGSLIFGERNYH